CAAKPALRQLARLVRQHQQHTRARLWRLLRQGRGDFVGHAVGYGLAVGQAPQLAGACHYVVARVNQGKEHRRRQAGKLVARGLTGSSPTINVGRRRAIALQVRVQCCAAGWQAF
ncbi:MAG: hypothetical protein IPK62_17315, partial [Bacteroidetes bacterium]|nr:hypothetical protein [Bacteroidota bacterium]